MYTKEQRREYMRKWRENHPNASSEWKKIQRENKQIYDRLLVAYRSLEKNYVNLEDEHAELLKKNQELYAQIDNLKQINVDLCLEKLTTDLNR